MDILLGVDSVFIKKVPLYYIIAMSERENLSARNEPPISRVSIHKLQKMY